MLGGQWRGTDGEHPAHKLLFGQLFRPKNEKAGESIGTASFRGNDQVAHLDRAPGFKVPGQPWGCLILLNWKPAARGRGRRTPAAHEPVVAGSTQSKEDAVVVEVIHQQPTTLRAGKVRSRRLVRGRNPALLQD